MFSTADFVISLIDLHWVCGSLLTNEETKDAKIEVERKEINSKAPMAIFVVERLRRFDWYWFKCA